MDDHRVFAGIVTFNPDIPRLADNIAAISSQVSRVLIFDNDSDNIARISELAASSAAVALIRGRKNLGIAYALNALLEEAHRAEAQYLLTLDQDSVASSGMVAALLSLSGPDIAIVSPRIRDRNKAQARIPNAHALPPFEEFKRAAARGAITSGSLLSVAAARSVGGFDPTLFIDYVDYDLNARLLLGGFRILRANTTVLLHEVGHAQPTWLRLPRRSLDGTWHIERFYTFGHSAGRCYYKARNRVIFTKKYGRAFGLTHEGVWQIPQQIFLTLLFEDRKLHKLYAFIRGIRDGVRSHVATYRPTKLAEEANTCS